MAKPIQAYLDNRGQFHMTPTSAVIGDIAAALGRVGDEGGLTEGVARLILEKRKEIEKAFADFDTLDRREPVEVDHPEGGTVEVLDLEKERRRKV
ncbi:hypothetical protein [Aurantiacibacter poecillastricola]|uniref:hypothetical protein n=1 Tax=Aurantiacibacter poecillastricola TaxID=3064385 RepID=UPI00273E386A|nr:hypothetical protein [Aurantiacibacter sp. 219JJ12-13]MDP5261581.1 hypothetical protein [Aurantiacibacter sp. 219JJ12-13]